ncbi:MAG: hypothetical protein QJR09_08105 [Micrococcus sp.]|nr:hypothetical protein [Micrococcus sp.]
MTTTYTLDQIRKARGRADDVAAAVRRSADRDLTIKDTGDAWAETFIAALGLTVEDPKPEPGIYLTERGHLIVVDPEGAQGSIDPSNGRNRVLRELATYSADALTPARVVPAEPVRTMRHCTVRDCEGHWRGAEACPGGKPAAPVELTEEQVGDLYDHARTYGNPDNTYWWAGIRQTLRGQITATVNAALRAHGHGTTTPSREDVEKVLDRAMDHSETACGLQLTRATDAVMDLLEGGKA